MVGERLGRFAAKLKDGIEDVVELVGKYRATLFMYNSSMYFSSSYWQCAMYDIMLLLLSGFLLYLLSLGLRKRERE